MNNNGQDKLIGQLRLSTEKLQGDIKQAQKVLSEIPEVKKVKIEVDTSRIKLRELKEINAELEKTQKLSGGKFNYMPKANTAELRRAIELTNQLTTASTRLQTARINSPIYHTQNISARELALENANSTMSNRFKTTTAYALSAQSIYMVRNGMKDLITTNKEYEASLVDLKRVLGNINDNELKSFGKQQIEYAKEFGLSLKETQASYNALAAAGIQKQDLSSMAKTVMLGLNTSDIKSGAEMANLLTTSMKQLDIEMTESEKVLDQWNYLADRSVATTRDYAEAVSKAGMTSKAIGIGLGELNAIVSVLSDNTGASGAAIGDALKSLETRLLRPETLETLKQYGIEVMADTNHFKSFGEIITQVSTTLDKFGENTVESNDILDSLGGTLRKNWANILASNYDKIDTVKAEGSIASVGYSATKSAAEMGTLDKKVQIFNATVKELYVSLGDSGLLGQLKGLVDAGTWLAGGGSGLASIILTLAEVTLGVKALSGAMMVLKGQNLTQILDATTKLDALKFLNTGALDFGGATTSVKAYNSAVTSVTASLQAGNITQVESVAILEAVRVKTGLASSSVNTMAAVENVLNKEVEANNITRVIANQRLEEVSASMRVASVNTDAQGASISALDAAQKTTAASALALKAVMIAGTLALTGVIVATIQFVSWIAKADERQKELLQTSADAAKAYSNEAKSIQDLVSQYTQLSASGKTDKETKDKLLEVQKQLLDSYGNEAKGLDIVNGKYQDQIDVIQKLSKEQADEYIRSNEKGFNTAQDALSKQNSNYVKTAGSASRAEWNKTIGNNVLSQYGGGFYLEGSLEKQVNQLKEVLDNAKQITNQTKTEVKITSALSEKYVELNGKLQNAKTTSEKMFSAELTSKYSADLVKLAVGAETLQKAMDSGDSIGVNKASKDFEDLSKTIKENIISKSPELKKAFEDWSKGLDLVGESTQDVVAVTSLIDIQNELSKSLKDTKNTIGTITEVLQKHSDTTEWDMKTIENLVEEYPNLLSVLHDDKLLEQELIKIKNEKISVVKDSVNKEIDYNKTKLENLATVMGIEVKNFKTTQEAKLYYMKQFAQKVEEINSAIANAEAERQSAIAENDKEAWEMATKKRLALVQLKMGREIQIDTTLKEYDKAIQKGINIDKLLSSYGTKDNDGKTNKAEKKEKETKTYDFNGKSEDIFQQAIAKVNTTLEKTESKISSLNQEISNLQAFESADNYNQILAKKNELLEIQKLKTKDIIQANKDNQAIQNSVKTGFSSNFASMNGVNISNFKKEDFDRLNPYAKLNLTGLSEKRKEAYEKGQELWDSLANGWINSQSQGLQIKDDLLKNQGDIINSIKEIYSQAFAQKDKILTKFQEDAKNIDNSISLLGTIDTPAEMQKEIDFLNDRKVAKLGELNEVNYETEKLNHELKTMNKTTAEGEIRVKAISDRLTELAANRVDIEINLTTNEENMNSLIKDRISKLASIEDEIVQALKSRYEKEMELSKEAKAKELLLLKNLTSDQQKLLESGSKTRLEIFEDEHDSILKLLNDELKAYEEVYNAKIKEIDRQEDKDSYESDLNKKQQEKSKLQSQYDSLLLDTSLASQSKRADLLEEIKLKEADINEFTHKHSIDLRKQNLQDELEANKDLIQDKIDKENESYKKAKEIYDKEVKALEDSNKEKLKSEDLYAEARRLLMEGNFEALQVILEGYGKESEKIFGSLGQIIKEDIVNNLQSAINLMKEFNNTGNESSTKESRDRLYTGERSNGKKILGEKFKVHKGGGLNTSTGWHWLDGTDTDPELVLNSTQTKAMLGLKDKLPLLLDTIRTPPIKLPEFKIPNIGNTNNQPIELKIDNLINIEGNADKTVLPQIKQAGINALNELRQSLNKQGIRRV